MCIRDSYLVLHRAGKLAFVQRPAGDIWQGLYDFPLVEAPEPLLPAGLLAARPVLEAAAFAGQHGPVTHVLTHQRIQARFFRFDLTENQEMDLGQPLLWADAPTAGQLPKPVLVLKYLQQAFPQKTPL